MGGFVLLEEEITRSTGRAQTSGKALQFLPVIQVHLSVLFPHNFTLKCFPGHENLP